MKRYIVRLDDACPTMNHENWHRMEALLDNYEVKPIVGVIPDSTDPDFQWPVDEHFWERARDWQRKGWTIAQHGLHHRYRDLPTTRGYFQLSHNHRSEWAHRPLAEQCEMLQQGYAMLRQHGLKPTCFYAPAHTFDVNTVRACQSVPELQFISDGYDVRPYTKGGSLFLPSICNGPMSMPVNGVFTFVAHPSTMNEADFTKWQRFLLQHRGEMTSVESLLYIRGGHLPQSELGRVMERGIYAVRALRKL